MSSAHTDLLRLLEQDAPPVDRAALLVAAEADPGVDVDGCLRELDRYAAPVAVQIRCAEGAEAHAELIAERLHVELGFTGNVTEYYDPRNSYLHEVMERRTGIPLTLAVVWIAVGRRAGVEMDGIGFPGHFLVRVGGEEGVLVDPFHEGRVLDAADVDQLARRFVGDPTRLRVEHLLPVDTRAMVVRMLMNLKHVHERRGDHARALLACDRLVDLTDRPEARRDRGLHALALHSYRAAADDLEAYLEARPTARDVARLRETLADARRRAEASLPS